MSACGLCYTETICVGQEALRGCSSIYYLHGTTMNTNSTDCICHPQDYRAPIKSDCEGEILPLNVPHDPIYIRENFTTSICLEWSNYIFLSDRSSSTVRHQ